MSTFAPNSDAINLPHHSSDEALALSRLEDRISPLLSVIAGMVDLTGFFMLGNIFTAHVTGNLVVVAALAVRGGPVNLAQIIAIPVFILALAAVWLVARASGRRGCALARLLLVVQFLLLAVVLAFSVITRPSASLKRSVCLLVGFLVGCVVAAAAISVLGDWAWSLPVALAALTIGFATFWPENITRRRDQR